MPNLKTPELLERLLKEQANVQVLEFLELPLNDTLVRFVRWSMDKTNAAFDEGGQLFFDDFGCEIPDECKYTLHIQNIMVNPGTAIIFAVHFGRATNLFRCDFERAGIPNTDKLRVGGTFDGDIDITSLGPDWALLNKFAEDEQEQLTWSWQLAQ